MRASLGDLLTLVSLVMVGALIGAPLWRSLSEPYARLVLLRFGIGFPAVLMCPICRRFKSYPLLLPRCPNCRHPPAGYYFQHGWPRLLLKYLYCQGAFAVWLDAKVGESKVWDQPILFVKWPYVFGRYARLQHGSEVER